MEKCANCLWEGETTRKKDLRVSLFFDRILRGILRSDGEDNLVSDEVREKG